MVRSNGTWLFHVHGLDSNGNVSIDPFIYLLGHQPPTCLHSIENTLYTACGNEIYVWEVLDGNCTHSIAFTQAITSIKVYLYYLIVYLVMF
jgi:hypothetical protein